METYKNLIDALAIMRKARIAVMTAEDNSPAWRMLVHADAYLNAQADRVMRGNS